MERINNSINYSTHTPFIDIYKNGTECGGEFYNLFANLANYAETLSESFKTNASTSRICTEIVIDSLNSIKEVGEGETDE